MKNCNMLMINWNCILIVQSFHFKLYLVHFEFTFFIYAASQSTHMIKNCNIMFSVQSWSVNTCSFVIIKYLNRVNSMNNITPMQTFLVDQTWHSRSMSLYKKTKDRIISLSKFESVKIYWLSVKFDWFK